MRLLVSVRDPAEALLAARGGADFIDLKEPGQGALGGLPVPVIERTVAALRDAGSALPISATIGDVPMAELGSILERVQAVGATGVDYVKVGIERDPGAPAVLQALARCGRPVVPVFIADRGLDDTLLAQALALGFPGVMADTADKGAGPLLRLLPAAVLQRFVQQARAAHTMVGLAGALRVDDAPALAALAPDFAGFRSAVCDGPRHGALSAARLSVLVAAVRAAEAQRAGAAVPSSIERARSSSVR
jgi:(5-formylfuran-3-yl)methyl phosphate synthase